MDPQLRQPSRDQSDDHDGDPISREDPIVPLVAAIGQKDIPEQVRETLKVDVGTDGCGNEADNGHVFRGEHDANEPKRKRHDP